MTPEELFTHWMPVRRKIIGMTQQELADALTAAGIKFYDSSVARIEKGRRSISLNEAYVIARALGTNLERMTAPEAPDDVREWMLRKINPEGAS